MYTRVNKCKSNKIKGEKKAILNEELVSISSLYGLYSYASQKRERSPF
jgi:hypothetical protein